MSTMREGSSDMHIRRHVVVKLTTSTGTRRGRRQVVWLAVGRAGCACLGGKEDRVAVWPTWRRHGPGHGGG
jgi:hypothetical protein